MSKYYTPEIEEFHIGFEYEWKCYSTETDWTKSMCDKSMNPLDTDCQRINKYRVKYLDEEDIESLGFTRLLANIYTLKDKVKGPIRLQYFENDNYLAVFYPEYSNTGTQLFQGVIKNKSELIRLLKQLEING